MNLGQEVVPRSVPRPAEPDRRRGRGPRCLSRSGEQRRLATASSRWADRGTGAIKNSGMVGQRNDHTLEG